MTAIDPATMEFALAASRSPLLEEPLREALLDALHTTLKGQSSDHPQDPGVALASALAVALDQAGFYHDRIQAEARIDTARLIDSMRKLGVIPGVAPTPSLRTSVYQCFHVDRALLLPARTAVKGTSAVGPTVFETLSPLDADPAVNAALLSRIVTLHSGATVIALEKAESSWLSSTSPADDFWEGVTAIVTDDGQAAETVRVSAARGNVLSMQTPLLGAYPDDCRVWRLTDVRRLTCWWPGFTHAPPADSPLDALGQQIWAEASDTAVAFVRDAASGWRSTLEVRVVADANERRATSADPVWSRVPDFSSSKPQDLHYTSFLDDRLHTWIAFRASRAVRPTEPGQIRCTFDRAPSTRLPDPDQALAQYAPAFTSPIVSTLGHPTTWAICAEDPGLAAGDVVLLAYASGAHLLRTLGAATRGRLLDWSMPRPAAGTGDEDGHEPPPEHTAAPTVEKASKLDFYRLEEVAAGPALTRLSIQDRMRRNTRQDAPDLRAGDTVLGVDDPSLFKVGAPVLVGCWDQDQWRSGEVATVSAIAGSALVLDAPLRASHRAPVGLLPAPVLASAGTRFSYVETVAPDPDASPPPDGSATTTSARAPKPTGEAGAKAVPSPTARRESLGDLLNGAVTGLGRWLLTAARDLDPPDKKEKDGDGDGDDGGLDLDKGHARKTPAATVRVPTADLIPLKEWERSSTVRKARERFVQTVTGYMSVTVDSTKLAFVDEKRSGSTYDLIRTPTGATSILLDPHPVTSPLRVKFEWKYAPPATGAAPPARLVDLDVKRTLFLAEAATLKVGADLFLAHAGGIAHARVVSLDGAMVTVDDGFDALSQHDVQQGALTTWNPDARPIALHPTWYDPGLALEASGERLAPAGDVLRLPPGAPGLDTLMPGDALTVWDEPRRLAWKQARIRQSTSEAPASDTWWQWPTYQAMALVASVEPDIGAITLETPLPELLVDGAETRLRTVLAWPATFRGHQQLADVRNLEYLASGPVFETVLAVDGVPGRSLQGTMGGTRIHNIEVFVRDPKSGAWQLQTEVSSLEGLKAPGVVVHVEWIDEASARITLAFGDKKGPGLPASGEDPVRIRYTGVDRDTDPSTSGGAIRRTAEVESTDYDAYLPRAWPASPWIPAIQGKRGRARASLTPLARGPGTMLASAPVRHASRPPRMTRWRTSGAVYEDVLTTDATTTAGAPGVLVARTGRLAPGQEVALDRGDGSPVELAVVASVDSANGVLTFVSPLSRSYPPDRSRLLGNLAQVAQGRTTNVALGVGDGTAGQRFPVSLPDPVLFSLEYGQLSQTGVVTSSGDVWRWVETLGSTRADARAFTLALREDATEVVFGDGEHGAVPPPGVRLMARLPSGPPAAGTVAVGALDTMVVAVDGVSSTTNLTAATAPLPQTPRNARQEVLDSVATANDNRLLTTDDIVPMARSLFPAELADVVLLPSAGPVWLLAFTTLAQDARRDEDISASLASVLNARMPTLSHVTLVVQPAPLVRMSFSVELEVDAGTENEVLDRIQADLADRVEGFFSPAKRPIGQAVRVAEVSRWLERLGARAVRFPDLPRSAPSAALVAPRRNQAITAGAVTTEHIQQSNQGMSCMTLRFTEEAPTASDESGAP